jgi:hypothetical protein
MSKENKIKDFLLDPLSVIIKLAIIGNKPEGTKISIFNNMIKIQEVGPFQGFVRYWFNNNKLDLHYLYNPIELACENFLDESMVENFPKLIGLFESALIGIDKLKITYKDHSMIVLCLNYYSNIISNYLGEYYNEDLFRTNELTHLYTKDLTKLLNKRWTNDKLLVVLELNNYLENNVNCVETFMVNIDKETEEIITNYEVLK